jgi:hypothetical protein
MITVTSKTILLAIMGKLPTVRLEEVAMSRSGLAEHSVVRSSVC